MLFLTFLFKISYFQIVNQVSSQAILLFRTCYLWPKKFTNHSTVFPQEMEEECF